MSGKLSVRNQPRTRKTQRNWLLVTNHQNMMYMLAAGMVMNPAGFRGKHYDDLLSDHHPGWIPLFREKLDIPAGVLNAVIRERKFLKPCIASLNLNGLVTECRMLPYQGKIRLVRSPPVKKGKYEVAIQLRAPLPVSSLCKIYFHTATDLHQFKETADDVANIALPADLLEVKESLFHESVTVSWPPPGLSQELPVDDRPPVFGLALGGILAMLYHMANRSEVGLATWRIVTCSEQQGDIERLQSEPILAELPGCLKEGALSKQVSTQARLFWGVIKALIDAQTQGNAQEPVDVVFGFLESQFDQITEDTFLHRLQQLIVDMRDSLGLGGGTITELFARHNGAFSRSLLLFCLRSRCTDLLEFSHDEMSDSQYIVASILFGVRDSWLQLPDTLRGHELSRYVAFRMAKAAHDEQGTEFEISPPPRPTPLRALFTLPGGEWNKEKDDVAVRLASSCSWQDCLRTRITLAGKDLPASFERSGCELLLPGKVVNVVTEIDRDRFLVRLGRWMYTARELEEELRLDLLDQADNEP